MDQSANNPATDRSGIVEALTATLRQPSFLRVVLILAATMGVLVLAVAPAVVLAVAEFGVSQAALIIAGVVLINILAENVLSPMMMGRGLNISPTIVFLSFIFWACLLGGAGAFLALPITLFVAVMFGTFPQTRWLAGLIGVSDPDPGAPPPAAEAEGAQ
jgi:AI-2 transport protein TqsA